jgi:putative acetyltransferase
VTIAVSEMTPQDYDAVVHLWKQTEGVVLSDADSPESVASYLRRNPGLSFVAREEATLVGVVLCGHDGRRGYLHHLAVAASHRRRGVGSRLVHRCLEGLRAAGIGKCHIFVFAENRHARAFWHAQGWEKRDELVLMSAYTGGRSGGAGGPADQ